MALSAGTWLNHYEILGHLGTGGMGEVYRARDNKLQREVALKVLPEQFARDPERLARFRREAQVLAQLNHTNIAAIYSVEQAGETHFLVMELALGETLRDRVRRAPVPIEEALEIAKQIAAGLECAHEKPIVHRDLKPANVKVTPEGVVKILDFGLARAFAGDSGSSDPADSPTLTGMTQPGTILGTAAYMSPEQAKGKTVDKRTDIWALGCVLFEMLTGKHAFEGEDVQDILAGVMRGEPDWAALPEATPTRVRELLRRCLQKDKDKRLRDAGDARVEMEEVLTASATTVAVAAPAAVSRASRRQALAWGLAALAACVLTGLAVWNLKPAPTPTVTRFAISWLPDENFSPLPLDPPCPRIAVSPDGNLLAYVGIAGTQQQLYLRSMDSLEARPVSGGAGGQVYSPFFSPDGEWLAFGVDGRLKKAPVTGGFPVTVASVPSCMSGADWGVDGTIVFSRLRLFRVADAGGAPEQVNLNLPPEDQRALFPAYLPGGEALLVTVPASDSINWDEQPIAVQRLDTGERRMLNQNGLSPRYVSTGHLVFARAGTILAAPFDPERLEVTGGPVTLVDGVARSTNGFSEFDISESGALVYRAAGTSEAPPRTLLWVDRNGTAEPLAAPPRPYSHPYLSPDGRQLAIRVEAADDDIWVYDIPRGTLTRLTFEGDNSNPLWTPDGQRIVYRSVRPSISDVFWKLADGTGAEEQITKTGDVAASSSISPDGKLAFYNTRPGTRDLKVAPLEGGSEPSVFLQTPFEEVTPKISPDGRWVAYISNESGRNEIYVRPFPASSGKWQISTEGGYDPLWARNGRELFYRSGDKVMAVDINQSPDRQGGGVFQPGTPRMLFEGNYERRDTVTNYDISPDGQRFLMIRADEQQAGATQIHVVLNWFEELKRRVPAAQ